MNRLILILFCTLPFWLQSQTVSTSGTDLLGRQNNPITVAVPFLNFAPDSRGAAMGDAGVASSPDNYSIHWNASKLAFIESNIGFSFSYSPWLNNIVSDMSLSYLTLHKKIGDIQTIGASFRYFDMGKLILTDLDGNNLGVESPQELAVDVAYARKLIDDLSLGLTGRFIFSNLSGQINNAPGAKAGTSIAVDLSLYYQKDIVLGSKNALVAFGFNFSNIGQKISYSNEDNEDFIPGNMRIGTSLNTQLDVYNSITVMFDINKLLVPTPTTSGSHKELSLLAGTFGSFGDAPRGFSEEMEELMYSIGIEYKYKDIFSVRTGYFNEHKNKGNRKYFTAGVGFQYRVIGVDFSYLISQEQNHPLGDTLRLSLFLNLDKKEKED